VAASGGKDANCGSCGSAQNFGWYFQSRSGSGKLPVMEDVMVVALVGGRYVWVSAGRPVDRRKEIAVAFGSSGLSYGVPQPDHEGSVKTA
jgi:hypothetical protein